MVDYQTDRVLKYVYFQILKKLFKFVRSEILVNFQCRQNKCECFTHFLQEKERTYIDHIFFGFISVSDRLIVSIYYRAYNLGTLRTTSMKKKTASTSFGLLLNPYKIYSFLPIIIITIKQINLCSSCRAISIPYSVRKTERTFRITFTTGFINYYSHRL